MFFDRLLVENGNKVCEGIFCFTRTALLSACVCVCVCRQMTILFALFVVVVDDKRRRKKKPDLSRLQRSQSAVGVGVVRHLLLPRLQRPAPQHWRTSEVLLACARGPRACCRRVADVVIVLAWRTRDNRADVIETTGMRSFVRSITMDSWSDDQLSRMMVPLSRLFVCSSIDVNFSVIFCCTKRLVATTIFASICASMASIRCRRL